MNPEVSRRVAAVIGAPILQARYAEVIQAVEVAKSFEALPKWLQAAVVAAEEQKTEASKFVAPDRVKGVPGPLEVARALSRLAILPNPNHPDLADQDKYVESPWAVVPLPTVDPNAWDDAVTVVIDLEDLYGTDAFLKRKNIRKHIETMGQAVTPYRSYALIAEVAGKLIIIDGHHRLMATWLLGQDTAAVYKIEIP
jgi:hypothetical protein